jgi:competence protein ComEC
MRALQFPLTRISIFFILGILAGYGFNPDHFLISFLLIFGLAIFIFSYIKNNFFGISCFLLSFVIGTTTQVFHANIWQGHHYVKQLKNSDQASIVELTIYQKLKNTTYNTRYVAKVNTYNHKKSCGKLLLNRHKAKNRCTNL